MTKKNNKSIHSNIINLKNKFKVKMIANNKIVNKDFKTEKQALKYRNNLWKKFKPDLYKKHFKPDEYEKEILENEKNKNKESEEKIELKINTKIKLQPGTIPIQNCWLKLIWTKQNNCCGLCKKPMKLSDDYEIDHIIAKCYDGPHELYNLQTLCINCHKIKTDSIDRDFTKDFIKLPYLTNVEKISKIKLQMEKIHSEMNSI